MYCDDVVDLLLRRALDLQLQLGDVSSRCRAVVAVDLPHHPKRAAAGAWPNSMERRAFVLSARRTSDGQRDQGSLEREPIL